MAKAAWDVGQLEHPQLNEPVGIILGLAMWAFPLARFRHYELPIQMPERKPELSFPDAH